MTATLDDEVVDLRRANAELQRRLDEALAQREQSEAQKAAIGDILDVINSSPGDLTPVFQAIVERAHSLCDAAYGSLQLWDGEKFCGVAMRGFSEAMAEGLRQGYSPGPNHPSRGVLEGEHIAHCVDLAEIDDPVTRGGGVALEGIRTILFVALRKDDALLGQIVAARKEVRPFTAKEIALVENFAAQAVIAMKNARLLTETHEALEQQTATAEVLQVINSSPGDLTSVFDAMLEKAMRLCEAAFGILLIRDGEVFQTAALHGVPPALKQFLSSTPREPGKHTAVKRMLDGEDFVHFEDMKAEPAYRSGDPRQRAFVELGGTRTYVAVALRRDGRLVGTIGAYRQEVRRFTDKQISLLQNFAAQAVIAMENARLLTETREALEQQTATTEVLQVINSSPGDLTPVFDAMLDKAMRLCSAVHGYIYTYDGERLHPVAMRGDPRFRTWWLQRGAILPQAGSPVERILQGEQIVHEPDVRQAGAYHTSPDFKELVDRGGIRTGVIVALRKDNTCLGTIHMFRREIRPFSDKQIALLQNFAAQAVIAMENARLLGETRETLEQQTATAEVLQVINSSPGDLAPVFDAILEKAHTLCGAAHGLLLVRDGEELRLVAVHGESRFAEGWWQLGAVSADRPVDGGVVARLMRGEGFVHIADCMVDDSYRQAPAIRSLIETGRVRTALTVPLRKDGDLLGLIIAFRLEVRPFTDKQIALLQNFAAQAVIAMENARLLNEIRQRQAELRVTFDNMVDGVAMFDEALRLAAWNRNFQQLLDLPEEFLAERRGFDEFVRYLTRRGEFGQTDPKTEIKRLRARLSEHYQFERTRPDGTVIEVRHSPMPDGGVVLIYSDITERKRSEAEIHAARDTAEAAYRDLKAAQASLIQAEKMASLGQLTAGIAHEIKNPLNFVNNFAGLSVELLDELKETAAPAINALRDEKRAEIDETITMLTGNLEKIAEHGRRADGIVKSMLEHSRGSSGERRSVDLNGLIEEALNLAYHGGRAQDASFNITLERDFAEAIAPIELVPQDITRVCLNLFGNGFYAATKRQNQGSDPKFKPTLNVSTRDLGDAVEIKIRDNGVGIPPEIKDKLFQPFFTTKPTGEGTGLGLSISYDIVIQEHGGTISVDSQIGEFTEFTVRLPRVYGATIAEAAS
jgi:two-component system NtrC family sensor kinase